MSKRTLITMVVTATIVVTTGATAFAKGPESATLTGPNIEQTIELTQSDAAIGELMQLSGIWFATGRQPLEPTGRLGPAYTLSWVNSGPPEASVEERTIRQLLYPYAEGGPLIHTPAQVGLVGWGGEVLGWFQAPDSMIGTMARLGVPVSTQPIPDRQTPDKAAAAALADFEASLSSDANRVVSVDNSPNYLPYLGIAGLGLVIAIAWVARRRGTSQASLSADGLA